MAVVTGNKPRILWRGTGVQYVEIKVEESGRVTVEVECCVTGGCGWEWWVEMSDIDGG